MRKKEENPMGEEAHPIPSHPMGSDLHPIPLGALMQDIEAVLKNFFLI
jgi:hypothetical protein